MYYHYLKNCQNGVSTGELSGDRVVQEPSEPWGSPEGHHNVETAPPRRTYQDILQKCLLGLVVISEILQFQPSYMVISGDRGHPPGDRWVVQRGTKVSQMFTLHVRNSLGWSASMWGHFKIMSLLGGHKGGALS